MSYIYTNYVEGLVIIILPTLNNLQTITNPAYLLDDQVESVYFCYQYAFLIIYRYVVQSYIVYNFYNTLHLPFNIEVRSRTTRVY